MMPLILLEGVTAAHSKVLASDELEIAGFFVKHGGFEPPISADADRIQSDLSHSDAVDGIYRTRRGGQEIIYARTEPLMEDLNQLFGDDS